MVLSVAKNNSNAKRGAGAGRVRSTQTEQSPPPYLYTSIASLIERSEINEKKKKFEKKLEQKNDDAPFFSFFTLFIYF